MKYLRLFALGSCLKFALTGAGACAYYYYNHRDALNEPSVKEYVATQKRIENLEERLALQSFPKDEILYKEYDSAIKHLQSFNPQTIALKGLSDKNGCNAVYAFLLSAIGFSGAAALYERKK